MAKMDRTTEKAEVEIFSQLSFPSLGLHPALCSHLQAKMSFEAPTLIQAQAIPVILSGRHVMVNAATGTGKTITYLAPIIHHLQSYSPKVERSHGTLALVLVPTRELCLQVYEILSKLLQRFIWIVPGYIMGGEKRSKEKARLRKGISILVATPGRLLDHLKNTSAFIYTNLRWIIFDEADRILELGYGKEIEEILEFLDSRKIRENRVFNINSFPRQNVLLSATLNEKVNHLANISLDNPVMIGIDNIKKQKGAPSLSASGESCVDESVHLAKEPSSVDDYKLPGQLHQQYVKVSCSSRISVLLAVLQHHFNKKLSQKMVVFFSTCDAVDFHHSLFSEFRWPEISLHEAEVAKTLLGCTIFKLHGNMTQEDRKKTFLDFKTTRLGLLLSTDVAARGLDFPKVKCIIQYDSPGEATEYVHRVGRTARLGEKGESMLFLQPVEMDYLQDLAKHGVELGEYPIIKLLNSLPLYDQRQVKSKSFLTVDIHPWVLSVQKALESFVSTKPTLNMLARKAFCSWVRAYTAHRGELKKIFKVKKLHLGHVAKSFALNQQPSLVGKSYKQQLKKRKRVLRQGGNKRTRIHHEP